MTDRASSFGADVLELLRHTREVTMETSRAPDAPVRSAVIWVVVDDRDRVLVRSWLGARGRWYRDLLANPAATLVVGASRVAVRAERATDPERVEACSRELLAKYRRAGASVDEMVADEILEMTLELHPTG